MEEVHFFTGLLLARVEILELKNSVLLALNNEDNPPTPPARDAFKQVLVFIDRRLELSNRNMKQ